MTSSSVPLVGGLPAEGQPVRNPGPGNRLRGPLAAALAAVLTVSAGGVLAAGAPEPARAAPATCVPQAQSTREAVAMAAACRQPVAVESSRSAYTQVIAQPDGTMRFESAVEPQRTRRADGSWAEVDLSLRPGADGLLRPAASVADVAFSAGGDQPLITLRRGGRAVTFSWPGRLPAPAVSGDSATYAGVLPDVDLVVRATRTGFTHVLVVRSARGAANPALREIVLRTGGDATVSRAADGTLTAAAGRELLARSHPAVMWDSSLLSRAAQARSGADVSRSDAVAAGDGARTAAVGTRVSKGELRLVPDAALLARGAFPLYIDPAWSVAKTKWAYATNDNCTNGDLSMARVGYSPEDSPCAGSVYRSFFEFPTTNGTVSLKGKYIYSAYVQMTMYHSWSCDNTPVNLYQSSVINASPKAGFSATALKTWITSLSGHANKGSGCSDSPQPDMVMNFGSGNSSVRNRMQAAADGNWNTITLGLSARDSDATNEFDQNRWKKFYPGKAKLVVDYDSKPGSPNTRQVSGILCSASDVRTVGTLTPNFSAILPDADNTQAQVGTFEWVQVPSTGIGAVTDTYPARLAAPPKVSAPANGRATTATVTALKDRTYAFRARSQDPAPYSQYSPWSPWCQFRVDNTVPQVTVSMVTAPAGPGQPGTFKISSTSTDVTKFRYGWNSPVTEVPATTVTGGKAATIKLTPLKYGQNVLYASAIDATFNEGYDDLVFTVGRPSPATGRWFLETFPGQDATEAVKDRAPALAGDRPLTTSGVTWSNDVHLLGGAVATMPATTSASTAQTSGSVVDTSKSFSVAAWVRRTNDTATYRPVFSQEGSVTSSFMLFAEKDNTWRLYLYDTDSTSVNATVLSAPSTLNQWAHLAVVYDSATNEARLFVNGTEVDHQKRATPPWASTGRFHLGWSKFGNGFSMTNGVGQIADVQAYDRALVPEDFTGQLASDPKSGGFDEPGMLNPTQVGFWDFNNGGECWDETRTGCEAFDRSQFNRSLALRSGADMDAAGNRGKGLALDGVLFGDGTPTNESARSAYNDGTPDLNGNVYPVWRNTPVLRTDQSFTISAWVKLDRTDTYQMVLAQEGTVNNGFYLYYGNEDGGVWKFKMVKDAATTDGGTGSTFAVAPAKDLDDAWHHVVGVLDVERRQLRLYVDDEKGVTVQMAAGWQPWQANGPLRVGNGRGEYNPLFGTVDDVAVYQGAMTTTQVNQLHDSQVEAEPLP
ncbi:LamG domain-containing protein [Micromonospora auratinigra]|uniref:Concanavalin A-like lectin/glucanases superfamily protein n=1 Tax=Micromonospora auratinigra TaxID=261654 RepID=A0A1A8ZJI1_9ACTN|nr:LamG domain-containing protein [Micromonospora auratinigra]SBT44012.1 Concanavalin A-like lectin/glucanases superfamily protein [Micromonospora auratinigra]